MLTWRYSSRLQLVLITAACSALSTALLLLSASSFRNTLGPATVRQSFHEQAAPATCGAARACKACLFEHPIVGAGATSGEKYNPTKTRDFNLSILSSVDSLPTDDTAPVTGQKCFRWLVTTTINPANSNLQAFASLSGWCKVFVLDKKSPLDFALKGPGVVILTVADQEALPYRLAKLTPWNHFGRKNIGYLYALLHGAELIYDTDDDNIIELSPSGQPLLPTSLNVAGLHLAPATHLGAFNPYPFWGAESAWPRGFPLSLVNAAETKFGVVKATDKDMAGQRTCYLQSLANADPDMDGIFRLTQPLPVFFPVLGAQVVLPAGVYAPANAQAALLGSEVAAALLLPVTVHGRVSDIWRSYILQRVMWDSGCRLAFADPWVRQYRNAHGYQRDFQAELDLYMKTEGMLAVLNGISFAPNEMPGPRVLRTFITLYEHGLVEELDVRLVYAYLRDLDLVHSAPKVLSTQQQQQQPSVNMGSLVVAPTPERAAVCITGPFRGGPFTLQALRSSVLEGLGMPFDIFVSMPTPQGLAAEQDPTDMLYFIPNLQLVHHTDHSKVSPVAVLSGWRKTALRDDGSGPSPQEWVRELTDLLGCKDAIRRSGQAFTHAVRVPADALVLDRLPVPPRDVRNWTIVVPGIAEGSDRDGSGNPAAAAAGAAAPESSGVDDRFAYGRLEDMMVLFDLLEYLPQMLEELKTEGVPEGYWDAGRLYQRYGEERGLAFDRRDIGVCRFNKFEAGTLRMRSEDVARTPACEQYCRSIRGCKS